MNQNQQKWADALRSGEFKQATTKLRIENEFCCLGVACEVYRRDGGDGYWKRHATGGWSFVSPGNKHGCPDILPEAVRVWLGLNSNDPELRTRDAVEVNATALNDDLRYSFDEIADAIERTFSEVK